MHNPRLEANRFLDAARVAAALLLGGLLVVRLLWTGVTYPESDAFVSIAALALLAALLAAVGCAGGEWRLRASADGGAFLYLLVLVALSIAAPRRWLARGVLLQAAACTAAYLVAADAAVSRRARLLLCAAFITGTLAVALYGLYQHFQGFEETRLAFAAASAPYFLVVFALYFARVPWLRESAAPTRAPHRSSCALYRIVAASASIPSLVAPSTARGDPEERSTPEAPMPALPPCAAMSSRVLRC